MNGLRFATCTRLIVLVTLLATGVGTGAATLAGTVEAGRALDGPDVVRFSAAAQQPPLVNAYIETLQGFKDANGVCHFSIAFSAPPGDTTPQLAWVVAVDLGTCVYQVERGIPTFIPGTEAGAVVVTEHASITTGEPIEEEEADARVSDLLAGKMAFAVPLASHNNYQATFSSYWEDPVDLDVNKVRAAVKTVTSGTTITSAECTSTLEYLTASGWSEVEDSRVILCEYLLPDETNPSPRVRNYMEAEFKNDAFCPGSDNTTYVDYIGNRVYVTNTAGAGGGLTDSFAFGGCSNLLAGPFTIFEPGEYY